MFKGILNHIGNYIGLSSGSTIETSKNKTTTTSDEKINKKKNNKKQRNQTPFILLSVEISNLL